MIVIFNRLKQAQPCYASKKKKILKSRYEKYLFGGELEGPSDQRV